jgi:ABC-type nitrate/sulfonate/bicarbonate transport system substrate-binding protein
MSEQEFDIRISPNPSVFDLPVLVARERGLFEKHGVNLTYAADYGDRRLGETLNDPKPLVRQKEALFEQGQADTYNVCEWGGVDRIERGEAGRAKIAALRAAVAAQAIVTFDPELRTPADLADVVIGINDYTGSHFTTLQLLEGAIGRDRVKTIHAGEPGHRYDQLRSGRIRAATLMEPFITLALKDGAHIVALTFYRGAEIVNPRLSEAQRAAYFSALNEAVDLINADFDRYAHYVTAAAKGRLAPHELGRQFIQYTHIQQYAQDKFEESYRWMQSRGFSEGRNDHAALVVS